MKKYLENVSESEKAEKSVHQCWLVIALDEKIAHLQDGLLFVYVFTF